jgi:TolB protein
VAAVFVGLVVPAAEGGLVARGGSEIEPAWSPDGKQIAFAGNRSGAYEIYVVNADGSGLRRLTRTPRHKSSDWPDWSPDGRRIVFASDRDGDDEIYVMDADGGDVRQLTHNTDYDSDPDWSPDGKLIAFSSDRKRNSKPAIVNSTAVFVMNADGSAQRPLPTKAEVGDVSPDWSPDGSGLAFTHEPAAAGSELWVMDADGGEKRRVTRGGGGEGEPAWSPAGNRIAFSRISAGRNGDVYVVDAAGGPARRLTRAPGFDSSPAWSPDGRRIVFASSRDDRDGDDTIEFRLYVMNADGGSERRLP